MNTSFGHLLLQNFNRMDELFSSWTLLRMDFSKKRRKIKLEQPYFFSDPEVSPFLSLFILASCFHPPFSFLCTCQGRPLEMPVTPTQDSFIPYLPCAMFFSLFWILLSASRFSWILAHLQKET